jgi:predicted  nucleic acid-binding Zn ribbon protein
MFRVTIDLRFKTTAGEEAIRASWDLSAALHRSGQTVGDSFLAFRGRGVSLVGVVHEKRSLSHRNDSRRSREAWNRIGRFLSGSPRSTFESLVESRRTCTCARVRIVIFDPVPHPLDPASPLECRACNGRVPLYRFLQGKDADTEYGGLLSAETVWRGFHWGWMDSAETEALGWHQIADPDSELNRLVRRRARSFAKRCGIKMYTRIQPEYWTENEMERSTCPGCGHSWLLEEKDRLSCSRCLLVSRISNDRDRPEWWRPLPRHRLRHRPRT